jgi:hypothetical protein
MAKRSEKKNLLSRKSTAECLAQNLEAPTPSTRVLIS